MTITPADSSAVRLTPSGHVHRVNYVRFTPSRFGSDLLIMACGVERRRTQTTTDFPSGCQRCRVCYPATA